MKNKVTMVVCLGIGAISGFIIADRIVAKKYQDRADAEIDSVKQTFKKMYEESEKKNKEYYKTAEHQISERIITESGYNKYSEPDEEPNKTPEPVPYVISPDEFSTNDDYDTVSLTYYADKVLADEDGEIIDNVEEIIGKDSLTHFGEYERDSVFVRNDKRRTDYEILLDERFYSDINSKMGV